MVTFSLLQERVTGKRFLEIPRSLEGAVKMLEKLGMKDKIQASGMDFSLLVLALGQKLMKASSEIAFLKDLGLESWQRRFNRFCQKADGLFLMEGLLKSLPKRWLFDPQAIWVLDDTPLKKSGKRMQGTRQFYSNGSCFWGFELLTLSLFASHGTYPRNRRLIYRNRLYSARDFIRLCKRCGQRSFEVLLPCGLPLRLLVWKRHFRNGSRRYELLVTNDFVSSPRALKNAYLKRWSIETLFRASKQSFALQNFHNRSLAAIRNHIAFSYSALILTAFLKSLFSSLHDKSLSFVRAFVFLRKVPRILLSRGFKLLTFEITPNPSISSALAWCPWVSNFCYN